MYFIIFIKWNKYYFDDEKYISQIYEIMSTYKTKIKSEITDNICQLSI